MLCQTFRDGRVRLGIPAGRGGPGVAQEGLCASDRAAGSVIEAGTEGVPYLVRVPVRDPVSAADAVDQSMERVP